MRLELGIRSGHVPIWLSFETGQHVLNERSRALGVDSKCTSSDHMCLGLRQWDISSDLCGNKAHLFVLDSQFEPPAAMATSSTPSFVDDDVLEGLNDNDDDEDEGVCLLFC